MVAFVAGLTAGVALMALRDSTAARTLIRLYLGDLVTGCPVPRRFRGAG